jgi:hypothetical protein
MLMAVAGVLLAPSPLTAHHGAANFDTGKVLTLEGTVTEWLWGNPHCFLKFEAKDFTGAVRTWVTETQNPVGMTSRGWSRRSFKAGDKVIVEVEPVKDGQPVGKVLTVVLPNGQKLYALGDGTAEGQTRGQ